MKKRFKTALAASLFISMAAYSQTPEQRIKITSQYDQEAIQNLKERLSREAAANKELTTRLAAANGWPETVTDENGNTSELVGVDSNNYPIYNQNHDVDAIISTRTNFLNTGGALNLGLDGQEMRIAIWEQMLVSITHPEFQNRVNFGESGVILFTDDHATSVMGVMLAAGINNPVVRGTAPLATGTSYDWDGDTTEVLIEASSPNTGLLISNHSYGPNPNYYGDESLGDYDFKARDWDHVMYFCHNYLMVTSAGNNGSFDFNEDPMPGAGDDFDKLLGDKIAKNNLVVANAWEPTLDADGNFISAVVYPQSSTGPTDDLRIKPDISANGTGVQSTKIGGYGGGTGTSLASPNVAGTLLLLQQYSLEQNNTPLRGATLKGLALHTADDILPVGPDARAGWGYLNAKKAAETMTGNGATSLISENTLDNNETYTFQVLSDGINPLSASICWSDSPGNVLIGPPSNNPTPILINNLNIRVSKNGTDFYPYRLTSPTTFATNGPNNVDPFERVDIENASGYYTIEVSHSGFLSFGGTTATLTSQDYSLIVTGVIMCTPSIEITEQVGDDENDIRRSYGTITAHNVLDSGANADYRAGDAVVLTNGFAASSGSTLLAHIEQCTPIEQSIGESGRIAMPQPENNGIIQNPAAKTLVLYPNPANTTVSVKLSEGAFDQISISTIDGKAISTQKADGQIYRMDISSLEKGIYVIQAKDNEGKTFYEKLIVE